MVSRQFAARAAVRLGLSAGSSPKDVRAGPIVGQVVFLPISAAARAELVPLALVVVVRVPNVQVKQAPEWLHLRSMAHTPA